MLGRVIQQLFCRLWLLGLTPSPPCIGMIGVSLGRVTS